ncbi:ABC transporter ATP-binding protein [Agromyces sp. G08B096]|uniref:ABC transporter ATP-binding protein n=1 Tax=Agromyces sp. G08B096 TaxID=3156399 RepID=A0AAU7W8S8_9MICO
MIKMTGAGATAIVAEALEKTYRRGRTPVPALRGLDFEVPRGSVFGMLGPNGAGKSTTTKILTTLSRPDAGRASVAGHDVTTDAAAVRRAVGYVSQGTGADPLLTGAENLALAGRLRGLSRIAARERATALLHEFGLTDAGSRAVGSYSGGMRRRLDVACALVHRPEVLFLDEPTTGLDPEARAAMWAEIRRLSAEGGLTVVLTTHYLEEADRLADELVIIDHGTKVVQGTAAELKSALRGDTVRVALFEPDPAAVRLAVAGIPALREVVVEVNGPVGSLVARTDDASAAVGRVIAALEGSGIPFGAVAASRPSLDDVYLHHVGRSIDTAARGAAHQEGAAA